MKLIQIIERNCSDKIQPSIAINKRYFADETEPLKDGTKCLLIRENKNSKAHKINAKRFKWREVNTTQVQQSIEKNEVQTQQELLSSKYSVNELAHQIIMPLVIYSISIVFVERLLEELARNKISETRKLSRTMKMLIQEWRNMLSKHQERSTANLIDNVVSAFMRECNNDFIRFYISVNNAVKREFKEFPYKDATTNAIIALQVISYANEFLNGISNDVKGAINRKKDYITSPTIDGLMACLKECLEAGAGNIDVDLITSDDVVKMNIAVMHNRLKAIQFEDYLTA